MALQSDKLSLDIIRPLEEAADNVSIELDGTVNLVQSKDGVALLRDEIDGNIVLHIVKNFLEDAVREKIRAEKDSQNQT